MSSRNLSIQSLCKRKWNCLFAMLVLAVARPTSAAIMNYDITGWAPAVPLASTTNDKPLRYQINVPDPNNAAKVTSVPVDVQVEKWPKAGMPNETAEASRIRKANAIKDAINAEFARLNLPQRAEVEEVPIPVVVGSMPRLDPFGRPIFDRFGRPVWDPIIQMRKIGNIKMKGLAFDVAEADKRKRTPALTLKDPTGQPAGGVLGQPGQQMPVKPMPSPGSMSGKGLSATGLDFAGNPSEVSLGYFRSESEYWIATLRPTPGQSDSSILMDLRELLAEFWQVPSTYESATNTLTLDVVLQRNDFFAFGSTDSGLDMEYAFPAAVPEPGECAIAVVALVALGMRRYRRR